MADAIASSPRPSAQRVEAGRPAVAVESLRMRFGSVTALEEVTFTVPARQTLVLWGANGAGKTTLLRCLLGLLPYRGRVRIFEHDARRAGKRARALVGYVPQEIHLHEHLSVLETVRFFADVRGVARGQAEALLETWRLDRALWPRAVRGLSGGMKQKLAVVIALLSDPPILLLDEPTSNLDVSSRRELSGLLEQLKRDGKTLVCCSHRSGEAWKLADRVLVLERGRCVLDGRPDTVRARIHDRAVITLTIPAEHTERAALLLSRSGFDVERNGTQLWVRVPVGDKAAPIQRLVASDVPIADLDVSEEAA